MGRGRRADDRRRAHRRPAQLQQAAAAQGHRRGLGLQAQRPDHHLRRGQGPVRRRRRQGPLRPGRQDARRPQGGHALLRRRPAPRRPVRRRPARPGLLQRRPGVRPRDPQPHPHRLRDRHTAVEPGRLRSHVVDLRGPGDAAQPLRLQGRHQQHQGRGLHRPAQQAPVGPEGRRRRSRVDDGRHLLRGPAHPHARRDLGPAAAHRAGADHGARQALRGAAEHRQPHEVLRGVHGRGLQGQGRQGRDARAGRRAYRRRLTGAEPGAPDAAPRLQLHRRLRLPGAAADRPVLHRLRA